MEAGCPLHLVHGDWNHFLKGLEQFEVALLREDEWKLALAMKTPVSLLSAVLIFLSHLGS